MTYTFLDPRPIQSADQHHRCIPRPKGYPVEGRRYPNIDKVMGGPKIRDSSLSRVEADILMCWSQTIKEDQYIFVIGATNLLDEVPVDVRTRLAAHVDMARLLNRKHYV